MSALASHIVNERESIRPAVNWLSRSPRWKAVEKPPGPEFERAEPRFDGRTITPRFSA